MGYALDLKAIFVYKEGHQTTISKDEIMRPIRQSVTGIGSSSPITFDYDRLPFNVGYGCAVTGTATYSVQHTFDDYRADGFSWANATWFTNASVAGATTNQDGNYAYPVTAIRVTISSGSGTVAVTAIQA